MDTCYQQCYSMIYHRTCCLSSTVEVVSLSPSTSPLHPLHCSPPPLMFGNKGHYLSLSCRCNSPILAMFIYGMSFMSYSNMLFCSIILYYIMQFLQAVRMLVLHLYCKLPKISFPHLYFLNTGQESEYYFMVCYK